MKKHFKKSHFLSQKLILHWLKKNASRKIRFFFNFRSHERSEFLAHEKITLENSPPIQEFSKKAKIIDNYILISTLL